MLFPPEQIKNILIVLLLTFVISFSLTRLVIWFAERFGLMVKANNRSSHEGNLALGGGLSVVGVSLGAWILLGFPATTVQLLILMSSLVIAIISWVDDLKDLSFKFRFLVQLLLIGVCLWAIPGEKNILPFDWPLWIDRVIAGFFWLWFINLFNFMDGIDGLAGVETATIGAGIVLIGLVGVLKNEWQMLALVLVGASLGFLPFNWHRARIILGDLGAVTIGFVLGFLLIQLALGGYWVASLILPVYFIADSTITILTRLVRSEKIWLPHRTHFYQRACQPTSGHDRVVLFVLSANVVLVGLALYSLWQPLWAGLASVGVVGVLLAQLSRMAKV